MKLAPCKMLGIKPCCNMQIMFIILKISILKSVKFIYLCIYPLKFFLLFPVFTIANIAAITVLCLLTFLCVLMHRVMFFKPSLPLYLLKKQGNASLEYHVNWILIINSFKYSSNVCI